MLKVFNTLSRKKEEFKPLRNPEVGIYSCGPTVYWFQHIGNLRTYIFSDILKRVLTYGGFNVKHVMNITDVGHLTSDADEGEDKMEKAAQKEGKKAEDIADFYWKVFREDFKKLNIIEPTIWCKATEHIKEQISLIEKLEKKGYTYKTSDGVYFDTSKFEDYGKLAKLNIEGLKAGKRIDMGEKRNKTDFALWKFSDKPGKRQQEWQSPWGLGYPGWHIECSAMSTKYLGQPIDIHTGGEDHVPIHHTNEIAQSECAMDKKFVNYWMHGAFLTFKGEKVSKSKGGLYTVSELQKLGYDPLEYRYMCLLTHYRKQLSFSLDNLNDAKTAYLRLKNIVSEIKDDGEVNDNYLIKFEKAIDDDLNMPLAMQVLWKLIRDEKALGKIGTIRKIDEVLGLNLLHREAVKVPANIQALVDERENARKTKDWKRSDRLRDEIKKLGFIIEDKSDGVRISRAK
jgi:cysteinyl-tRNA synthetase